ncbi:MAG TPA: hypothetical protein VK994_04185 [Bacteroidales bacterium]|nr:hypothetical protein [Bacteroidales bacterium]
METLALILIALSGIFAVYWTFRIKKVVPMIINFGMALGILLVLIPALKLFTVGLYIYMGFVVLAFFHGLADKDKKLDARLVICLMSAGIFIYWLWVLNHWHGNTILAPIFVLLIALAGILTKAKLRSELGFLTVIAVDAIAILLTASQISFYE